MPFSFSKYDLLNLISRILLTDSNSIASCNPS